MIPNTGEVHGRQCFVTVGSAAVLTACRERLPQTRGMVLCWGFFKELFCGEKPARPRRQGYSSPVARPRLGAAHPDPLRSDVTAWTQPSCKALLPCQQFFIMALMCTTWDGVSFICLLGFPCCTPLRFILMLGHLISQATFPSDPSSISPVSFQACVKSHIFFQLLGWI